MKSKAPKALMVALAAVFTLLALYLSETTLHSGWVYYGAIVSFIAITWTIWYEFRPRTETERLETRPLRGVRFLIGMGGAFNMYFLFVVVWFVKGSVPVAADQQVLFGLLNSLLVLLIPLTIWASSTLKLPTEKANEV